MSAILRKIKADLLNRRLATFLVTLTITASAALLTLTAITFNTTSDAFERSFDELNGAHLWLYFDRTIVSRADVVRAEGLPGVIGSTGLQFSQVSRIEVGPDRAPVSVRQMDSQLPVVNRLRVMVGRYLAPDDMALDPNGVLVDNRLAEQYHIQPGDVIQVAAAAGYKPLQVVGLAFNPTWDTYRTSQPPYLYVLDRTFQSLFPDRATWDWSVGLRLAEPKAVKTTFAAAQTALKSKAIQDHTDWRDVRWALLFDTQINALFLTVFGLFALAATALILTNSISGVVLAQFRDIGVLKALGFTGNQVALVYLGQNLTMGLVGGVLGIAIGVGLAPLPLRTLARSLNTTPSPAFDPVWLIGVLLAILLVVWISTLWPAWRGARVNTIQAITTGYELPSARPSRLAALARTMRLPLPVVMGVKDVFARRGRATLTFLSLLVGVMSLVFSFELNAAINTYLRTPSLAGVVYDATVSRGSISDNSARRILAQSPGVQVVMAHATAKADTTDGKSFRVRAQEGDLAQFPYPLEAGRLINLEAENEAMIGVGLQMWLGLKVGDILRVTVNDKRTPVDWQIVGVYREPANSGQMAIISLQSLRTIDRAVEPDRYYLRLSHDANVEALRAYLKSRADESLNLTVVNTDIASLEQFRLTMLALSVALAVIALISVFNSAALNVHERIGEVGTFKTLGMTPGQVIGMILSSSATLGVLAAVPGVPLGVWFVQAALSALGRWRGFGSMSLSPDWSAVILPALVALTVSLLGSAVPARWAARINVVEVLHYE